MKKMRKRFKEFLNNTERVDLKIIIVLTFLCLFGCMMVYSASSYVCATSADFFYDDAYLLKKQILFIILGIVSIVILVNLDYHIFYWIGWGIFGINVILILLLKTPLGVEANGAVRWLNFGVVQLHVGEMSKMLLILFLAFIIAKHGKSTKDWKNVFKIWIYAGILAAMILIISSNLSSCLIMLMITYGMTFIWSNTQKFHLVVVAVVAVLVSTFLIYIYYNLPDPETANNMGYQMRRILGWMDPEKYKDVFSNQILQSLYAVGSGGLFGKGLGKSMQKLGKIPEPQNDMIFAIICEELGIFGGIIVLILMGYLILQIVRVAISAKDLFGAMIAVGVALHFSFQTIVNVAVSLNVFPNTGVSLPFISYGGSALLVMFSEVGLVLSVRRYRVLRDFEKQIKNERIIMR